MEKDSTIIHIIHNLKSTINFTTVDMVDDWDSDLCSIAFKKENRLVYISTFNYIASPIIKYDFDFELVDNNEPDKIKVIKKGRAVTENELAEEIVSFLNLSLSD